MMKKRTYVSRYSITMSGSRLWVIFVSAVYPLYRITKPKYIIWIWIRIHNNFLFDPNFYWYLCFCFRYSWYYSSYFTYSRLWWSRSSVGKITRIVPTRMRLKCTASASGCAHLLWPCLWVHCFCCLSQ